MFDFTFIFLALCVNFSQSLYNIDENKGPVQLMLILSYPSTIDIIVTVFSNDESATGKYLYIRILITLCNLFSYKDEVLITALDLIML